MKKLLMVAPVLVLLAGCAGTNQSRNAGSPSGAGSIDAGYGNGISPTQQGAGAAAVTSAQLTPTPTPTAAQLSDADARFIQRAIQDGQAEINMGTMIVQKAVSPEVKNFGQRLVDDHTPINQQLAQIAAQKSVTTPAQADAREQREMERLSNLSGTDFERTTLRNAVRDHEKEIQLYQDEINSTQDPDLKAFAQSTVPILQQHLTLARQLLQSSDTTGSQGGAPPSQ